MFKKYMQLRKDGPIIEEMFRKCDMWGETICGFDQKRYYVHVFLPTMEMQQYMEQTLSMVSSDLATRTVLSAMQNNRKLFESITKIIFNDTAQKPISASIEAHSNQSNQP